jgi:hypothetical protein
MRKFNSLDNFNKNDEHGILDNIVSAITNQPEFEQTIKEL